MSGLVLSTRSNCSVKYRYSFCQCKSARAFQTIKAEVFVYGSRSFKVGHA